MTTKSSTRIPGTRPCAVCPEPFVSEVEFRMDAWGASALDVRRVRACRAHFNVAMAMFGLEDGGDRIRTKEARRE